MMSLYCTGKLRLESKSKLALWVVKLDCPGEIPVLSLTSIEILSKVLYSLCLIFLIYMTTIIKVCTSYVVMEIK